MRKAATVIKNILFALAIVILILAAAGAVMKIKSVIVLSGSMEPVMGTGSLAFINQRDTDIKEGDIIAFNNKDMWIAHRVIGITDEGYITKGDNNENADLGIVIPQQVQGTVFFWIPKAGNWLRNLTSTTGIIIVSTICFSLLLLGILVRQEEQSNEDDEGENQEV